MHTIEIIAYHPAYKQNFIDLNKAWLKKYFVVEPHDDEVFANIEKIIINAGGEIFFCIYDGEIAGTAAMQKHGERIFELTKTAVTEKHQGKGLSKLLMQACINFAREKRAEKIFLLSNRALTPAISLYKKFGFKEVPLDPNDYVRADIQMELNLENNPAL